MGRIAAFIFLVFVLAGALLIGCKNPFAANEPTYKVSYHGNSNTGGSVPSDTTDYLSGDTVTVRSNSGNLIRDGYVFIGWNTQADGATRVLMKHLCDGVHPCGSVRRFRPGRFVPNAYGRESCFIPTSPKSVEQQRKGPESGD